MICHHYFLAKSTFLSGYVKFKKTVLVVQKQTIDICCLSIHFCCFRIHCRWVYWSKSTCLLVEITILWVKQLNFIGDIPVFAHFARWTTGFLHIFTGSIPSVAGFPGWVFAPPKTQLNPSLSRPAWRWRYLLDDGLLRSSTIDWRLSYGISYGIFLWVFLWDNSGYNFIIILVVFFHGI
jgi:hypothetical protein